MSIAALNWMAIVVAALSAFVIGGLWYGPLFGKAWQTLAGLSDDDIQQGHPGKIYGGAFALTLVAAIGISMLMQLNPAPDLVFGLHVGIHVGLAFVATSFGINYLFARRPLRLFLIDAGYMVILMSVMGSILGAWR